MILSIIEHRLWRICFASMFQNQCYKLPRIRGLNWTIENIEWHQLNYLINQLWQTLPPHSFIMLFMVFLLFPVYCIYCMYLTNGHLGCFWIYSSLLTVHCNQRDVKISLLQPTKPLDHVIHCYISSDQDNSLPASQPPR